MVDVKSKFFKRLEDDISSYLYDSVEVAEGVTFNQHKLIRRIYKFKNRQLKGSKINQDLSYDFYTDIIGPRVDSEVKNLRFDTKHLLLFSQNPTKDFAAVFVANAALKKWLTERGEDVKLKEAVEAFSMDGNVGFKRTGKGYEILDPLNTYIINPLAKTVNETDIVERYEMTASEIMSMSAWDPAAKMRTIENLANKSFSASEDSSDLSSSKPMFEIFEFTGEMSEEEYYSLKGLEGGDEYKYMLVKGVFAGLRSGQSSGNRFVLFCDVLKGDMEDHYIYAHRGRYNKRFWREGLYELLFDYQIRANQITNDLARGLEWASKVVFKSSDRQILENIRADLDNGDVLIAEDISQLEVRIQGADQLIADWNRIMQEADRIANSFEIVRGDALPSGTPFRLGALLDENAGKLYSLLRQKLTLPYKVVFHTWVLRHLVKDLKGQEIFTLVGDTEILDQLREIIVEKWYMDNLVNFPLHTKEVAKAIKAEKLDQMRRIDPTITNSKEIWEGVLPRIMITITGENSNMSDQVQDIINFIGLEQDPERIGFMLDLIYRLRQLPIPPRKEDKPTEVVPVSGAGGAQGLKGQQMAEF